MKVTEENIENLELCVHGVGYISPSTLTSQP